VASNQIFYLSKSKSSCSEIYLVTSKSTSPKNYLSKSKKYAHFISTFEVKSKSITLVRATRLLTYTLFIDKTTQ